MAWEYLAPYKASLALMPDLPMLLLPCTSLPDFMLVHAKGERGCASPVAKQDISSPHSMHQKGGLALDTVSEQQPEGTIAYIQVPGSHLSHRDLALGLTCQDSAQQFLIQLPWSLRLSRGQGLGKSGNTTSLEEQQPEGLRSQLAMQVQESSLSHRNPALGLTWQDPAHQYLPQLQRGLRCQTMQRVTICRRGSL